MNTTSFNIEDWAKEQWEMCELGDSRRNKRAVKLAVNIMNKPDASLPCQLEHWKDLKAAYRLLNREEVSHHALQENHWNNVCKSAEKIDAGVVLFIQDTSELDYSARKVRENLGFIGNHRGRGIMMHSNLAVSCKNNNLYVLGLASQYAWIRDTYSHKSNETKRNRSKRFNESKLWERALSNIEKPPKLNTKWISVGDRANDIFDFLQFCKISDWDYVVRANQNRKVIVKEDHKTLLKDWVRTLPGGINKKIWLRGRKGQPAREISLQISWGKTKILCPSIRTKKEQVEPIEAWCIRCWENTDNGLEWILLTNLPITDANSALEKIDWYSHRWIIEEYHKCLKTGCSIEKRQLKTKQGLLAMLGFLGVIATRLLEMKYFVRFHPDELAVGFVQETSLKIICTRFNLNMQTITFRQFWHKVAALGGFIGRKSDGDPGWQTLWKGWLRLLDMLSGVELMERCG